MIKPIVLIVPFLLLGCSSSTKLYHLPEGDEIDIEYIVTYPSYSGATKREAKENRKNYLHHAIEDIMISIYRIADYGTPYIYESSDFSYEQLPFKAIERQPLILKYDKTRYYGALKAGVIANRRYTPAQTVLNPIAQIGDMPKWKWSDDPTLITTSQKDQKYFEDNLPILTKKDLSLVKRQFNMNYSAVGGKERLPRFLQKVEYPRLVERAPETNPGLSLMFISSKSLQYGSGIAREEVDEKNTLKFAIDRSHKFIWGTMLVLNSKGDIERIDKKTVKVRVKVPIKKIIEKYRAAKKTDYIEQ